MNVLKRFKGSIKSVLAVLVLTPSLVNAATTYDILLNENGTDLYSFDLIEGNPVLTNISTVDIDEVIGLTTTGVFNATAIEINYSGDIYTLADAVGAVTVEWQNGDIVDISYATDSFNIAFDSANKYEIYASLEPTPVPVPGALLLFSSALGLVGLAKRKRL